MADYRKFWLINSNSERYDFTDEENTKTFLNEPAGLGFNRTYSTIKVGDSELITSQELSHPDITGELLFYGDNNRQIYLDYETFIKFVMFSPLEMHYQIPNDSSNYYCNVLFVTAEKGEIDEDRSMLPVNVTFHRLTDWMTDDSVIYEMTRGSSDLDGKYHDLLYNYHYTGSDLRNTVISNSGTMDTGFIIKIDGYVKDPTFTLSQANQVYGICSITGEYNYVMVNSIDTEEDIYLENTSGLVVANPKQYQDFDASNGQEYLTWLKFKVGQSNFSFSCSNFETFDGLVTVSFKPGYISV